MANSYTFSVQQVQIAAWLSGATYDTPYTLESTKMISYAQKMITDQAQGNSKITDLESQFISGDIKLDTAGMAFEALTILTGQATSTSTGDSVIETPNALLPYFGIVAEAWYGTVSSMLLWYPWCKITSDFSYAFDFGKIIVPKFACMNIVNPTLLYMEKKYKRPSTRGSITFPPTV